MSQDSPRFTPLPTSMTERVLDFTAALGLGIALLLAYRGFTNHFLIENATLLGKWPLLVLPALASLVMYLVFWIQRSDWPISLPFRIQPIHFEKVQRQVRLLLRLVNGWMQAVLAVLLYLYIGAAPSILLLVVAVTALLVDLVLLFFFVMRLSRYAA